MSRRKNETTIENCALFAERMERVKTVTLTNTQVQLAEFLDVRQSSVSDAKRRCSIPSEWLLTILSRTNVNPAWILNGDSEMKFRTPNNEPGTIVNVKELRQSIEAEVREELDNLHAEDLIHRLEAMGLHVQVCPTSATSEKQAEDKAA